MKQYLEKIIKKESFLLMKLSMQITQIKLITTDFKVEIKCFKK